MGLFGYDVGKVTEGAFKIIFVYFAIVIALIAFSFIHGTVLAILKGAGITSSETIGFAGIIYEANKLFLIVLLLPLGVLVIVILILNMYFPFLATLLVDLLNNIFQIFGWSFTPLVSKDALGNPTFTTLDATLLVDFYFSLVNAMADILLKLSVFDLTPI